MSGHPVKSWSYRLKQAPDNYVVISKEETLEDIMNATIALVERQDVEDRALLFAQEIDKVTDYDIGRFYGRIEGYKEATDREEKMYSREEVETMLGKVVANSTLPKHNCNLEPTMSSGVVLDSSSNCP